MPTPALRLDSDDFTLFGLPQQQALARTDIDARWRDLQAQAHPDRFAAAGAAAQRVAMQWAVRINQAHQRLKDPLRRAATLCALRGAAIDAERNTAMPPDFLQQQMAWREALDGASEAADLGAVAALQAAVAATDSAWQARLQDELDVQADAHAAAASVRALMFLSRFRQDIERRLDALDPGR